MYPEKENNKPIEWGFAMSGGAAKCFAELGVLKAFAEAGISPGIISGTSAGALVGALIADGYDPEEILGFFSKKTFRDFTDFVVPHSGISKLTKVQSMLEKHLQARTFEELKIPLSVTASDFDRGLPVHFSQGTLILPLLASCCVPIVFMPVTIDGTTYVDGGLFQNLPAAPIRRRCEKLIGVDVNPLSDKPYGNTLKTMAERTISLVISSTTKPDAQLCDIVIRPREMTGYTMLDVDRSGEIFDIGYLEAKKILDSPLVQPLVNNHS